jgi:nitrogen fixation protein NifU and related proteins
MATDRIHFPTQSFSDSDGKKEGDSSRPAIQRWLGPYNEGVIEHPDSLGRVTGPCGDTMEISLRIENNAIIDSRFQVDGCAVSRACASMAAALAKGKELEEAWDIDEGQIAGKLLSLPEDHRHCSVLARDTLRQAIENFLKGLR